MRIDSGVNTQIAAPGRDASAPPEGQKASAPAPAGATSGQTLAALTRSNATLRAMQRGPTARPARPAAKARVRSREQTKASNDESAIDGAEQAFKDRVGERARNKPDFHKMMKGIYGDRYNEKTVEGLRQRALAGDFSFLPKARFVSSGELNGNHAAYDASSGTILLNENLKSNPRMLADYYAEEAGHHMDTFFGKGDAVGDEGELLRHALNGTSLNEIELAAIRAEDDRGTITVDGKQIEVEFGFFKKIKKKFKKGLKKVKNGFKKIGKGISKLAKKAWKGIKKAGMWLMTSTVGQYVMTAALAAFSVITAGAGTVAMMAWEAAKQAALAVARSVIVKKSASFVAKVTGSKTLGRIAGIVGAAFAGGKINVSSTSGFISSAGKIAKDVAVSEAKRAVKQEVLSKIDSPLLQTLAGFATDAAITKVGDYAYDAVAGSEPSSDADKAKAEGADKAGKTAEEDELSIFDVKGQAKEGLRKLGKVDLGDVVKKLAPKELANVIRSITDGELDGITLKDLAVAVKKGFNNFQNMSAGEVADALQFYVEGAVRSLGEVDADDVKAFVAKAFEQAGELKADDIAGLAGLDGEDRKSLIKIGANLYGSKPADLTLGDLLALAQGESNPSSTQDERTAA